MGFGSPTCPRPPPSFSLPSPCGLSSMSRSQTSTSRPSPISNEPSQSAASFSMAISSASGQTSTGGPSRPSVDNQPDSLSGQKLSRRNDPNGFEDAPPPGIPPIITFNAVAVRY